MIYIIVNPIAGNGNSKTVFNKITEIFDSKNIPYRYFFTKFKGNGKDIAEQSVLNNTDMVLSVGGDGTTFEIIDGLINTSTPLGIIPAGTGNDFVKAINMPQDPIESLMKILSYKEKALDVGLINNKPFLNVSVTGIDVSVLQYANLFRKHIKGNLSYIAGLFTAIAKHKSKSLKIIIDDKIEIDEKVVLCSIANGKYIGGGIPIASYAEPDDAYFDVIILKDVPRISIAYYLSELVRNRVLRYKNVRFYRARKVEFHSKEPIFFQSDGEIFELNKAIIKILHKAINVICEEPQ